jgi:pimeloyl-ACP methyl ester carboxylesterase
MWLDLARRLSDTVRTYAIDLPNYGASDTPIGPFTMDIFVDAVHSVVTAVEDQPVIIGGIAMGSYFSTEFTGRYPELVRGVVLQGCPIWTDPSDAAARQLLARLSWWTDETGFPKLRSLEEVRESDPMHAPKVLTQRFVDQLNQDLIAAGRRFWDPMPILAAYDLLAGLRKITVPTLMIWGEDYNYAERGDLIISNVADPRVSIIEGAGMHPQLDNPEQYDAALRGFIAGLG